MKKFIFISFLISFSIYVLGQWSNDPSSNNPISLASGEQAIPLVATSENGTSYIAWFSSESGNYNVRLQKLDVYGNIEWDSSGLLVSDHEAMSYLTDWDMTIDQEDFGILTFQDVRNGYNNIYAYRISPEGEFIWGDDGLALSNSSDIDAAPKVAVTNSGNIVIAWAPENEVVIMQKITPDGTLLWGESGIILSGENRYSWPQLIAVGDDDVILKFFEDAGQILYPTRHILAQRYNATGNPVWDEVAVITDAGGISGFTRTFSFINDGQDGLYIAWYDERNFPQPPSIFVQHIGSDGSVLFADDGIEATTNISMNHYYAKLALPPGSDDIFVYWRATNSAQSNWGIYGQKLSSTGQRLWTDNGKSFIDLSATNVDLVAARNSVEDMVVIYEESTSGINAIIKAMRIDTDGNYVWEDEKIDMCTVQSEKVHSVAGSFYNDQWIATWEDSRNGPKDIYAQNIQLDGSLGPIIISYELTLSHDTLFFNPGSSEEQIVTLYNTTPNDFLLLDVEVDDDEDHVYWYPFPLPYNLMAGDSVELNFVVPGEWKDQTDNYDYYNAEIIGETDTLPLVIAIVWGFVNTESQTATKEVVDIFPNPAKDHISFSFKSDSIEKSEMIIFNSFGKKIKTLCLETMGSLTWDLKDETGQKVPGGTYFYWMMIETGQQSGKIILIE